jgi:hypothetical protein
MQENQRLGADLKETKCPRCLQLLPGRVARCPNCNQPIQTSSRALRLAIGIAGLLALIFAMAMMYRTVYEEDLAKSESPQVQKTPEEQLFPDPPTQGSQTDRPPDKKPPLNEK